MRRLLAAVLAFGVASSAMAGLKFTPLEWFQPEHKFELRMGTAWYHDMNEYYGDTVNDIAAYVQTPIAEWTDVVYISFGGVFPLDNMNRSRPEFALNTRIGYWCSVPQWLNWELGGYWAVSPYDAVGVQVGFINLRF